MAAANVSLAGANTMGGAAVAYGNGRFVGVGTHAVGNVIRPFAFTTPVGPAK